MSKEIKVIELTPTRDIGLSDNNTTIYGSNVREPLGIYGDGNVRSLLLDFNFGAIPKHALIQSANLSFYVSHSANANSLPVSLQIASANWVEGSINYVDRPSTTGGSYSYTFRNNGSLARNSIAITPFLNYYLNYSNSKFGFYITPTAMTNVLTVNMREAGNNLHPILRVEYIENTAPTLPGNFTSPTASSNLVQGQSTTVAWGASTDADGDSLTYQLERSVNGGSFSQISTASTRSRSFTIPSNANTIQFRVRAYDGYAYSSYRTSSVFNVSPPNNAPTLTLANPANNKVLSEAGGENSINVEGSAVDTDSGDTVTVKYQINSGTIRNLTAAVSNGSTPISFAKLLTYNNKRLYDGSTVVTGDLAENTDHTLKVWAEDGNGASSAVVTRSFRVTHNRAPVITGEDTDLGSIMEIPSFTYQVEDLEGHTVTVTEKLNGQMIRSFEASPNTDYTATIPLEKWIPLQLRQHTLTVEATDEVGAKSTRTYTFTRNEDTILFELEEPFETDIAAERILITPDAYLPVGSSIKIEVCNNAFDEEPTWEDMTAMALQNRGYMFDNQDKTAEEWGINIRFTIEKGTAIDQVRLNGFGGAFE